MSKKKTEKESEKIGEIVHEHEKHLHEDVSNLTLLRQPLKTLKFFTLYLIEQLSNLVIYYSERLLQLFFIFAVVLTITALYLIEGPHSEFMKVAEKNTLWYGGWIVLGIASSAGIGSGLHTFLLYLGPYIALSTLKAYSCGSTNFSMTPESHLFSIHLVCNEVSKEVEFISILSIAQKVMWESFCWGAGTAIGELPPYFIAKAAAMAGEKVEEGEIAMMGTTDSSKMGFGDKMKLLCYNIMKYLGFWGILLLASVPNPLFDLAGIFSGLLKFSFWKFFIPTLIGKGLIKVSMQTFFIITIFSKTYYEMILEFVKAACGHPFIMSRFPQLYSTINEVLESSKKKYEAPSSDGVPTKGVLSYAFDVFFYLVLGICLYSIIQSLAQLQYKEVQDRKLKKAYNKQIDEQINKKKK